MSTHATRTGTAARTDGIAWATGLASFAAILMVVNGVWAVLLGIAAVFRDEVYVEQGGYVYGFDLTAWGWLHIALGVVVAAAGLGVVRGATWALVVAVLVAGLSLVVNFVFIPYQPVWSILVIVVDVVVIWALVTHRPDGTGSGRG
jgi:hypothetical protein